MDDDFKELEDKTTYLTMVVLVSLAMIVSVITRDTRIFLIGAVVVAVPVTFALAMIRQAWNRRSRRRRGAANRVARGEPYKPPSTRRT